MTTNPPLTPAQKKAADAKAKVAAEIAAKTGSTPGTSASGSQDFGSASTNYTSWGKTVSSATFDMSKFPNPTLSKLGTQATGEQVLQALSRLVSSDPGTWQNLRPTLLALGGQTLPKNKINKPWTSTDENAIKDWLTTAHYNAIDVTPGNKTAYVAPNLYANFHAGISNLKAFGSVGAKVSKAPPIIPLPATADLNQVAQDSFAKILGRHASPDEAAHFAKQYQDLVLSYGQGKADIKNQTSLATPGTTAKTPSPVAIEQPPSADVAATNFALKADPARAASNGLDDAMSSWFSTLEKGVGK